MNAGPKQTTICGGVRSDGMRTKVLTCGRISFLAVCGAIAVSNEVVRCGPECHTAQGTNGLADGYVPVEKGRRRCVALYVFVSFLTTNAFLSERP